MLNFLFMLVVLGLAVAGLAWLAWVSIQSLLQARLLSQLSLGVGSSSAVHGPVELVAPVEFPGVGACLWYHTMTQRYKRGKHGGWRTVHEEVGTAEFAVRTELGPIWITGHPTEVQGFESRTDYDEWSLGGWFFGGRERTVTNWLSLLDSVTVVGRLDQEGDALRIVEDRKVGLLVTPLPPAMAAFRERLKGWCGLAFATVALFFAIIVITVFLQS